MLYWDKIRDMLVCIVSAQTAYLNA